MKMSNFEILIPFKGKNPSGESNDNFLLKYKNVYFMDNPRLALWCWMQNIDIENKYNFLHIDRGERIRTSDLVVPNHTLYQAEPLPVIFISSLKLY